MRMPGRGAPLTFPFALALVIAVAVSPGSPTAWAQPVPVPARALAPEDAAAIRSVRVVSAVPNLSLLDNTRANVNRALSGTYIPPGAGAAGLLGVVIGAAIGEAILRAKFTRTMEEFALELPRLLDALGTFDPNAALSDELEAAFAGETRFPVDGFEHLYGKAAGDPALADAGKTQPRQATLVIESTMAFSETVDVFTIQTVARMARPGRSGDAYARIFIFESPPLGTASIRASMDAWTADDAALFRGAVAMGAASMARMVMLDLLDPKAPAPPGRSVPASEVGRTGGLFDGSVGAFIGESGSVVFVREGDRVRAYLRSARFTAKHAQEGLEMRLARGGQGAAPARPLTLEDLGGLLAPR